jgi:hypothetical protein
MFSPERIANIYEWLLTNPFAQPQPPGTGRILLSNGREMIGTWGWHADLRIGHFTDTGGIQWIIDVDEIVAFSPVSTTPGASAT